MNVKLTDRPVAQMAAEGFEKIAEAARAGKPEQIEAIAREMARCMRLLCRCEEAIENLEKTRKIVASLSLNQQVGRA
jgi:hypothetical protein